MMNNKAFKLDFHVYFLQVREPVKNVLADFVR